MQHDIFNALLLDEYNDGWCGSQQVVRDLQMNFGYFSKVRIFNNKILCIFIPVGTALQFR